MANGLFTDVDYFGNPIGTPNNGGITPEAFAFAKLDPSQMGAASAYAQGQYNNQMLQRGLSGLLNASGIESPIQQKQRALQEILGGIDTSDHISLQKAASQLLGMGMTSEANELMKAAQEAQKNASTLSLNKAHEDYYKAQGQKATAPKEFAIDAAIEQIKTALADGRITPEQAQVAYQNVLKGNAGLNSASIALKQAQTGAASRAGLPPVYNAAGIGQGEVGYASPDDVAALAGALNTGKGGSGKVPTFKQAFNLTAQQINDINSNPQSASYYMGAQQQFANGDVESARQLMNNAVGIVSQSAATDVGVTGTSALNSVEESLKPVKKLQQEADLFAGALKQAEQGNPKAFAGMESVAASLVGNSRAQAEIERLSKANPLYLQFGDFVSKVATGVPTNLTLEQYKAYGKALREVTDSIRVGAFQDNLNGVVGKTSIAKDVKSFASSHGLKNVEEVGTDDSKPDGYVTRGKDGYVYFVKDGKVYKGGM